MKIGIKISIISFCLLGTFYNALGQVYFGIKSGLNLSSQIHQGYATEVETNIIPTSMIGGLAEFVLSNEIQIETGLQFQVKGVAGSNPMKFRTTLNYIYVPVIFDYRINNFMFGIGYYDAVAVGGKYLEDGNNEDLNLGEGINDAYSKVDFGLIFEGGYLFEKFRFTINYDLGLANIVPQDIKDTSENVNIKNDVFGVGVSYYFIDSK